MFAERKTIILDSKKNIIVAGYPKSGTTWVTRLVSQLMDCPSSGYWGHEKSKLTREGSNRKSEYRCFKAHHLYHELFTASDEKVHRIIYVVRDPRDIVISGAFHFQFYHSFVHRYIQGRAIEKTKLGLTIKKLDSKLVSTEKRLHRMLHMLIYGKPTFTVLAHPWDQHISSYPENEVLFIRYEDLINKPLEEARRILTYLSYYKPDEVILDDIEKQSFDYKKSVFLSQGDKKKARHLRAGTVGQWKKYLTERDHAEIEKHFKETMIRFGYLSSLN